MLRLHQHNVIDKKLVGQVPENLQEVQFDVKLDEEDFVAVVEEGLQEAEELLLEENVVCVLEDHPDEQGK